MVKALVGYGRNDFHNKLTASGERYNMYRMTAAHRTYALNTGSKSYKLRLFHNL